MGHVSNQWTSDKILEILSTHAAKLRELGVVKIGLFGSQVRQEAIADSDIDILVTLVDHKYSTYCNVLFYLEDLFESKIDLVLEGNIRPELRPSILSDVNYV
jgi:uncharacterized protein